MDWLDVKEQFNFDQSAETLRKYAAGWKMDADNEEIMKMSEPSATNVNYKETTEILSDGSYKSDKLISMSNEDSKNVDYLLKAHGFSTDEWELVNARNNIWNVNSIAQGVQTLFSSKITVKPKKSGFNMSDLLEAIKKDVNPIILDRKTISSERLLEIPLFDMHFGIADLAYYNETYTRISDKIQGNEWDTILFIIGQDLLHNDGFTGKTTSGTLIEQVNTEQAWADADSFYTNLITLALKESQNVSVVFSNGNHDQGISYGFVKMLEAKFPQATFDTKMKQRKGYVWNNLFLGFSHGDKGGKRLEKNFLSEFGKEIAGSTLVEIHSGHIHHEVTKDDFGIVVRSLATKAKTDGWHDDNGFIGAMKRFQLFEYTPTELVNIHYV